MSIKLMSIVWELDLPDSEKLVLLALADSASDAGKCWPSMPTLARKCSKGERTVQGVIKALIARRLLTRLEKPGKGVIYRVYPAGDAPLDATPAGAAPPQHLRPAKSAPPQGSAPTPAVAAGKPSRTVNTPNKAKALLPPAGGRLTGDDHQDGVKKPAARRGADRGTRLPADWVAPTMADLPAEVRAIVTQWPAGAYELTAIQFRNHWRAESRAMGSKKDWLGTWCNWLIRESAAILRAAKVGQSFAGSTPGGGALTSAQKAASFERQISILERQGRHSEADDVRRQLEALRQPAPA